MTEPTFAEECAPPPTSDPIPTDESGLYDFIASLPSYDRWLVAGWLRQQDGRDHTALVDQITGDIANSEAITARRAALTTALADAVAALDLVHRIRNELVDDLYDVEHAEGGALFPHYLDEADRALRTAVAVNPTK